MKNKRWAYFILTTLSPLVLTGVASLLLLNLVIAPYVLQPQAVAGPVYFVEQQTVSTAPEVITGTPTRMVVPSVGIDIGVEDGVFNINTASWTLTDSKAHYATVTVPPNNIEGNTFIYGHNIPQVFSALGGITAGDQVLIHTDNGHVFTYEFTIRDTTDPDDLSLFEYEGAPKLTLQTCSGFWNQNRDLLWFDLVDVS